MIIFLNGCSSSGKSTIARAIQHLDNKPWLTVGIDLFTQMMPDSYTDYGARAHEGFHFISEQDQEGPLTKIEIGPYGWQVIQSAINVVASLAEAHNLIVDEVMLGKDQALSWYINKLEPFTVYFIGVYCDLLTLQEREILRGNRALGLGRDQIHQVHTPPRFYDLTIDTTHQSPFECAQKILDFVAKTPRPESFKKLQSFFEKS